MDFQQYLASESAALVARLLASQSGHCLQHLQSLRQVLDGVERAVQDGPDIEREIQDLVARTTAAARHQAEDAAEQGRRLAEEARHATQVAETALQVEKEENAGLRRTIAHAEADAARLERELQTAQERAEAAERDLTLTVNAHGELERLLSDATAECKRLCNAHAQLETEHRRATDERARLEAEYRRLGESSARAEREFAAVSERLRAEHGDLQRQVEQLQRENAASEERLLTYGQVAAERDALRSELERVRQELAAAAQQVAEAEQNAAERTRLEGALAELREQGEAASARYGSDMQALTCEIDRLTAALATSAARAQTLEEDLVRSQVSPDDREALTADLAISRARVTALEDASATREEELFRLQVRLDEALAAESRWREGAEAKLRDGSAQRSGDPDSDQVEALRWDLERMVALFDSAIRGVNGMAEARSSADLLSELVKRLSIQFSRVALFRIKGQTIAGELQIGFDDIDISSLVVPLSEPSLLTRAANSGAVESITGVDIATRLRTPFSGSPSSAVALPILLQGTPVAVVYADDADVPEYARGPAIHETSVAFARLLVGEAGVLLMCHTHELKTLAELRQYAATLLQEAKEMYLADAQAGRSAVQLRARLKENIECASQLYTYRAAMEGTAAAALLDEQIAEEISRSSAFSRDLAEVLRSMEGTDLGITAEAS